MKSNGRPALRLVASPLATLHPPWETNLEAQERVLVLGRELRGAGGRGHGRERGRERGRVFLSFFFLKPLSATK